MSLLLDARKKSQQAGSQSGEATAGLELSLEPHPGSASQPAASTAASTPDSRARATGQNLFDAKSRTASSTFAGANRNLLIALGITVLLLAAGAGYVWYAISPAKVQRPVFKPVVASVEKPAVAPPQNNLVPNLAAADATKRASSPRPAHARASAKAPAVHKGNPVIIEQRQEEPIDPLLNSAYLDYRNGNLAEAQQRYSKVLTLDANNSDALLGLAAIAQRRGEDSLAAH
jgi:hypothetical protein